MERQVIGIVGGVGPLAGVSLHERIVMNTDGGSDQDHLSVAHLSYSQEIEDRTNFILDNEGTLENPAGALFSVVQKLYDIGATVIGVPCNSAHAKIIFSVLEEKIAQSYGDEITLVNMIEETCNYIQRKVRDDHLEINTIGLLATKGTYEAGTYIPYFENTGLTIMYPETAQQRENVHQSIYHPQYGIKSVADRSKHHRAKEILMSEGNALVERGANALILGCTEIPLVLSSSDFPCLMVNPTDILAQALVNIASSPQQ